MPSPQKWVLIGWLILLALGIISLVLYNSKELTLLRNSFNKEINSIKEEIKKLREDIKQIKIKIFEKPKRAVQIDKSNWKTYRSQKYGFEIDFPKDSEIKPEGEHHLFVILPDTSTSFFISDFDSIIDPIISKHFEITIFENFSSELCSTKSLSEMGLGFFHNPEIVELGNLKFEKATGEQQVAGPDYYMTSYVTFRGKNCFVLICSLRYDEYLSVYGINVFEPKYEQIRKKWFQIIDKEKNFCDQIVSTFQFINFAP